MAKLNRLLKLMENMPGPVQPPQQPPQAFPKGTTPLPVHQDDIDAANHMPKCSICGLEGAVYGNQAMCASCWGEDNDRGF